MKKFFQKYSNKKIAIFLVIGFFSWMNFLHAQNTGPNYLEDQDGDGLPDVEELAFGTDPTKPDTDGDGYSDFVEIQSGYDPLVPAPGDRIVATQQETGVVENESVNLTETILSNLQEEKSAELGVLSDASQSEQDLASIVQASEQELSLTESEIKGVVENSLEQTGLVEQEMQLIPETDLKILPVPQGDSAEEIMKLEKKQVEAYFVQVAYIMTENFGYLSGSQDELLNEALGLIMEVSTDIEQGDDSTTVGLKEDSEEMYEKIKALEVPYVLKDVHVLSLSLFGYLLQQDESLVFGGDDPAGLSLLVGKLEGSMMEFDELSEQAKDILDEYEIETFDVSSYMN